MRNKYKKNTNFSESQFRKILHLFCLKMDALKVSEYLSFNRNTINRIYHKIRLRICDNESPFSVGEIELDESYLGGKRQDKRGRGAIDKAIVFGILKRNDKLYTQVAKNCSVPDYLSSKVM